MSDATSQAAVATEENYSKSNPFPSLLKQRRLLNHPGSTKEVQHLELCLAGSGIEYQPGDSLAIIPTNSDRSVSDVIEAAGFDADEMVESRLLGQVLKIELAFSGLHKSVFKNTINSRRPRKSNHSSPRKTQLR